MTSNVATKVGRKFLQNHAEQMTPVDPVYEMTTDSNTKKKKKQKVRGGSSFCE